MSLLYFRSVSFLCLVIAAASLARLPSSQAFQSILHNDLESESARSLNRICNCLSIPYTVKVRLIVVTYAALHHLILLNWLLSHSPMLSYAQPQLSRPSEAPWYVIYQSHSCLSSKTKFPFLEMCLLDVFIIIN